jgi:hypothetical protein
MQTAHVLSYQLQAAIEKLYLTFDVSNAALGYLTKVRMRENNNSLTDGGTGGS